MAKTSRYHAKPSPQGGDSYDFYLAGTSFVDDLDVVMQGVHEGDDVELKPEPSNPYDSRAVSVRDTRGNHLGYIPAKINSFYHDDIRKGKQPYGFVKRIQFPDRRYPYYSIFVEVEYTKDDCIHDGLSDKKSEFIQEYNEQMYERTLSNISAFSSHVKSFKENEVADSIFYLFDYDVDFVLFNEVVEKVIETGELDEKLMNKSLEATISNLIDVGILPTSMDVMINDDKTLTVIPYKGSQSFWDDMGKYDNYPEGFIIDKILKLVLNSFGYHNEVKYI